MFSYIYTLPFWREQTTWYRRAFGAWEVSGATTLQSGRPLNLGAVNMEVRVEFYNAPHHFSYFGVNSTLGNAAFGQVTSASKDFQAWEFVQLVESAGKDFVGIYLDTGNPVYVFEDPLHTVEILAPYAVTVHLRDSVLYEHPRGVAVQWVPLGEGIIDFKAVVAKIKQLAPRVYVYVKPITGRPPDVVNYLEADFWKLYPNARARDLARFLRLAKSGRPYERNVVIEDIPGRIPPAEFVPAIQYQQREHMERSIVFAKEVLGLGVRWRRS